MAAVSTAMFSAAAREHACTQRKHGTRPGRCSIRHDELRDADQLAVLVQHHGAAPPGDLDAAPVVLHAPLARLPIERRYRVAPREGVRVDAAALKVLAEDVEGCQPPGLPRVDQPARRCAELLLPAGRLVVGDLGDVLALERDLVVPVQQPPGMPGDDRALVGLLQGEQGRPNRGS